MTDRDADGVSWTYAQIAELLQRSAELHLLALETVGDATADLPEDARLELSDEALHALDDTLTAIIDVLDQLQLLSERLPSGPVEITYADLRRAAGRELVAGAHDPERAVLAARTLDASEGWPILAAALRCTDAHASWNGLPAARLLTSFRRASDASVDDVLTAAGLETDLVLADCDRQQVSRLAAALDSDASPPPAFPSGPTS